jgi:hypothetical protein
MDVSLVTQDLIDKIKTALEKELPLRMLQQKKDIVKDHGAGHMWAPLSPVTVKRKGHDQPWVESGLTMSLMDIVYQENGDSIAFYVDQDELPPYAKQVNDGAQPGTGRFVANIPARPLFNYTAVDRAQIKSWVREIVKETLSGYSQ